MALYCRSFARTNSSSAARLTEPSTSRTRVYLLFSAARFTKRTHPKGEKHAEGIPQPVSSRSLTWEWHLFDEVLGNEFIEGIKVPPVV